MDNQIFSQTIRVPLRFTSCVSKLLQEITTPDEILLDPRLVQPEGNIEVIYPFRGVGISSWKTFGVQ